MRITPLLCLCGLLAACDNPDTDAPIGADPTVPAAPGEARAGVVREGGEHALFGGINAEGRAGDVKIYNDRVQFVVQGVHAGHGLIGVSGGIIDVDIVRDDGSLGRDLSEDLFLGFGLSRLFDAETVTVLNDGSGGGPAVVQAVGSDVPWPYMMGLLERSEPVIGDLGLRIVQTYTLPPDSDTLHIATQLTATADDVRFTLEDGMFLSGEDAVPWTAGVGFGDLSTGQTEAVTFVGRSGESALAMWPKEGTYKVSALSAAAADLGIMLLEHPETRLTSGESLILARSLTVGRHTAATEASRHAARARPLGLVEGSVTDGISGVRMHFVDEAGRVGAFAQSDLEGRFSAALPPGDWTAYAVAHHEQEVLQLAPGAGRYAPFASNAVNAQQLDALAGRSTPTPARLAAGHSTPSPVQLSVQADTTTPLTVALPPASGVAVTIRDLDGGPLPAVVELRWREAPPTHVVPTELHASLAVPSGSRAAWAWTADGEVHIPALPGIYDLIVHHSWRHSRQTLPAVTVQEGEVTTVEATLRQVVPTDGWLALDPHLHGSPSFDGALPMEDRLITCAATGVHLPVLTDHDALSDYGPLATALGLNGQMQVVTGLEVTTVLRGHFNLYPLRAQGAQVANGGAVPWWLPIADTEQLFERMHDAAGDEGIVQVNHPRSPGMFGFARYKPETGEPFNADYFSWKFEAFELLNGGAGDMAAIRDDWFSFLNHGVIRTPTGASDSHYRYIPCGQSRTDVLLDTDDPSQVTPQQLRQALLAGHVVVASGTTLRATMTVDDATVQPGDTVIGTAAQLNIRVQTPAWIAPGTLRVYQNGEVVHSAVLTQADADGVWFDAPVAVSADSDAWFVVEVQGDQSMGDTWRGSTPYAVTNAFFVDTTGDGWTAPQ